MTDYDLIVRGAKVIDPAQDLAAVCDIAIAGGRIAGVGDLGTSTAATILDATGMIASPGWIDMHVHVFGLGIEVPAVDADREAGIHTGVTTIVDAGSAGAGTWDAFQRLVVQPARTRVLGYMNVSLMPQHGPIHGDWRNFSQGRTIALAEAEAAAGRCIGIKVLASQNHVGNLGLIPMQLAWQASRLSGTGLMVHLGEAPPIIQDVLALMGEGDVLTHCFKGTAGNILGRDRKPLPETRAALARGMRMDLGHGQSSFSFETARRALDAGVPLHAISTDLHGGNVRGPVWDMATTMAKGLHLGFSLPEVVRLSTLSPAQLIGRADEIGSLAVGREADVTLFRVLDGAFDLVDSERRHERGAAMLQVEHTIRAGELVHSLVDDGRPHRAAVAD